MVRGWEESCLLMSFVGVSESRESLQKMLYIGTVTGED